MRSSPLDILNWLAFDTSLKNPWSFSFSFIQMQIELLSTCENLKSGDVNKETEKQESLLKPKDLKNTKLMQQMKENQPIH